MSLELKKKKLELERVTFAKKELEFKIEERLYEIERIKEQIVIQDKRILELNKELGG